MASPAPRRSVDSYDSALSPISQRSGYGFPSYESSQRSGPSNRYRRGSTASVSSFTSISNSIGGSLDTQVNRNNSAVKEAGQNAISNLLQPPLLRTGLLPHGSAHSTSHKPPTTRDIPPVTLTNIPHVEPSAFRDYLTRIGPLFESSQRGRAENKAAAAQKDADAKKQAEGADTPNRIAREDAVRPSPSRQGSAASLSPIESPHARRRSSAYARRKANEPTALSTIPNVYFEENFHLENPRTFDIVSERAEIVRPPPGTATEETHANGTPLPPRRALATNAILQEKLSWYMDTVEVHLINSISAASTSFFAALGSLRDLQHEAEDSVNKIQKLRADLAALDQGMAMGGLKVASMRRKRENIRRLGRATLQVQRVVDQVLHCEELVDDGQYDAASDGINAVRKLIAGEHDHVSPIQKDAYATNDELLDLRGLKALQGLSEGIQQMQFRIGKGFEARFLETLLTDLRRHIDKVPPTDTMRRWVNASQRSRGDQNRIQVGPPAYLETDPQLRADLLNNLGGLGRSGHTAAATAAFREAVMKEMKTLIRKHLPSSSDDDTESVTSVSTRAGKQMSQQEKSAVLARNLRALDDEDAENLLVSVYANVSEALRRLGVQVKLLLDVTSSFGSRPSSPNPATPPRSPVMPSMGSHMRQASQNRLQDELSQALDMSSLLGQAVDVAQTQITRVLKVRAEQSHKLPLERFLRYFTLNRLFADECEAVSGRSGQMLKGIVNTQINAFVHNLGETENQRIAIRLDGDQWEAKDFQERDQVILSRLLAGMTSDPAIWTKGTRIWEEASTEKTNGTAITNGTASAAKGPTKPAYIDETRYILVNSAISLLPTLDTFLALIASMPSMASTAIPAFTDILRTFNSRSCQLILGAGATRSAGLKNITTKHLALASQALSFIVALIPYLREGVRRHIGGRSDMLVEFDKVKRLYQDHQMGIHDKLVEIMTARANAHINAMKKINFDAKAPDQVAASPYMETLTKETGTLHRVLGKHLAEPDIQGIMSQIFASYRDLWVKAFSEVEVKTEGGKARLLKDAELLDARLCKIGGFGDIGSNIVKAVKAKTVEKTMKSSGGGEEGEKDETSTVETFFENTEADANT